MNKLKSLLKPVLLGTGFFHPTLKGAVKFSALVTDIKGKIAGLVFQGGKAGSVLKRKSNRNTVKVKGFTFNNGSSSIWSGCMALEDTAVKNRVYPDGSYIAANNGLTPQNAFRIVSRAWSALSKAEQATWNAASVNHPGKNRFGEVYTPSGFQFFCDTNLMLLFAGFDLVSRTPCYVTKEIDELAQETVFCLVCPDLGIKYCVYPADDSGTWMERIYNEIRLTSTSFGNGAVVMKLKVVFGGKERDTGTKIIALIEKIEDFENYVIRGMLNKFFGRNIEGAHVNYELGILCSDGGFIPMLAGQLPISVTPAGQKFALTELNNNFVWHNVTYNYDFGNLATGLELDKIFLMQAVMLNPKSVYTIAKTGAQANQFQATLGNPLDPITPPLRVTDVYGNVNPVRLNVKFKPTSPGVKNATITFTETSTGERFDLLLTGIGI